MTFVLTSLVWLAGPEGAWTKLEEVWQEVYKARSEHEEEKEMEDKTTNLQSLLPVIYLLQQDLPFLWTKCSNTRLCLRGTFLIETTTTDYLPIVKRQSTTSQGQDISYI